MPQKYKKKVNKKRREKNKKTISVYEHMKQASEDTDSLVSNVNRLLYKMKLHRGWAQLTEHLPNG